MTFLPKDYELPESPSNYMKFEDGKNKIRILSHAITGWEYWVTDEEGNRKPRRVRKLDEVPAEFKDKVRHFWAFVVWNYNLERIQILEITQKTIMRFLKALVTDETWGDPRNYDIVITRSKTGTRDIDVEYSIMPLPKSDFDSAIIEMAQGIELEALYRGDDPFANWEGGELEHEMQKMQKEIK